MKINIRLFLIALGFALATFVIGAIIRDVGQYNENIDTYYDSAEPDDGAISPESTDQSAAIEDFTTVKVYWPGLKEPPTSPAAKAPLDNHALVIGVVANGTSRAYLLDAFKLVADTVEEFGGGDPESWKLEQRREPLSQLIVNDVVGGVPITVAFSEVQNLETGQNVRVLTLAGHPGALEVWLAELTEDALILNYQGTNFRLWSTEHPLQDHPFQVTTWQSWLQDHPATDAYIGGVRLYSGELKENPSVVFRGDADAGTLYRSAALEYQHHIDAGLDVERLYDVLEIDPQFVPAHELLAEHFAREGNEIMAQSHRAQARDAARRIPPGQESP